MREIWDKLRPWFDKREAFVLATVVKAGRPVPRRVGSVMAIAGDGTTFLGSVSAGCVENAVIDAAVKTAQDGCTRWESFGGEEGFPWEVALTCGGRITVRLDRMDLQRLPRARETLESLLEGEEAGVVALFQDRFTVLKSNGEWVHDTPVDPELFAATESFALTEEPVCEASINGDPVLFYRIPVPDRLFIVGAGHAALHLIPIGKSLLYHTVAIDPREAYFRQERFPVLPDQLHRSWPAQALALYRLTERDAAVVLSHDPKIDDDALKHLLATSCGYIGALGSRGSHRARLKRLAGTGIEPAQLERIDAPVGIDISSRRLPR